MPLPFPWGCAGPPGMRTVCMQCVWPAGASAALCPVHHSVAASVHASSPQLASLCMGWHLVVSMPACIHQVSASLQRGRLPPRPSGPPRPGTRCQAPSNCTRWRSSRPRSTLQRQRARRRKMRTCSRLSRCVQIVLPVHSYTLKVHFPCSVHDDPSSLQCNYLIVLLASSGQISNTVVFWPKAMVASRPCAHRCAALAMHPACCTLRAALLYLTWQSGPHSLARKRLFAGPCLMTHV